MSDLMGKKARDKITGFTGIITGHCYYLYGCDQYCLVPPTSYGKLLDSHWFDSGRIEVIGPGVMPEEVRGPINGGPQDCEPEAK